MSSNTTKRRVLAAVAGMGLVAAALPATAGATSDIGVSDEKSKVSSAVSSALDADGSTDVWFALNSKPDLSAAEGMGWNERGQYVYDSLRANAEQSQAGLLADLEAEGVEYEAFWINNAVFVPDADAELVERVAASGEVAAVLPDFELEPIEPIEPIAPVEAGGEEPQAITNWGLDFIKAPQIWEEYDQRGEGIVVGTFDTGVEADHPALVNAYRGTETGSDDYNWFDSRGQSETPVDPHGHGTHVTGTMVGDDGGENQIGVAPGASFIGSAGCCVEGTDVVATFQWFLAPTPVGSDEGDPAQRPHIINNSWGYGGQALPGDDPEIDLVFQGMQAWTDAGIFHVWAAGNDGYDCDSVSTPAWNDLATYSVANHQQDGSINDNPLGPSSRGPGEDGEPGVDIAAPGTDILSSVPGGGYGEASGTSMAAPHVAGSVALLWAEFPELQGDLEGTIALLDEAAIDTEDPTCGGPVENNDTFGEGQVDLVALFEAAGGDDPEPPATVVERWAGGDRYDTAKLISEAYPDGTDTVYVATGQDYADAMAGAPSAAKGVLAGMGSMETPDGDPAPVLLVKSDAIPADTATALEALGASNVVVLGGESRISAAVATDLGEYGEVTRIEGEDRYDTAANLAAQWGTAETVVVASGEQAAYPDALTGGAWAAWNDAPILLTQSDGVPAATAEALESLGATEVVVLGGEDAIDADTYAELGGTLRVAGDDRYETGVEISSGLEPGVDVVYVAFGEDYPDALAGSALAGSQDAAVLLTRGNKLSDVTAAELERLAPASVVVLGGEGAIDADTYAAIEALFPAE